MKRFICWCLVLIMACSFGNTNITKGVHAASINEYENLREKWGHFTLGGDYDVDNPSVIAQLEDISQKAQEYWGTMDKSAGRTYLWSDLSNGENDGTPMGKSYRRVETMVKSYAMEGSLHYQDEDLLSDCIVALDWLYDNWYNEYESVGGNWWWWEIGVPKTLVDLTIILYDELTSQQRSNYMAVINRFAGDPAKNNENTTVSSAANRVDLCKIVVLEGIISEDSERILEGRDALSVVYPYVTSDDGYYTDGSYVDHHFIAYTHSYGNVLLEGVAKIQYILSGSTWDIDDPDADNVFNWVYDSYESTIYQMRAFDYLRGRGIANENYNGHKTGKEILGSIALLAESADSEDKAYFKGMIKSMVMDNPEYDHTYTDIFSTTILDQIKNDPTVEPRQPLIKHVEFNNMDRSAHFADGFAFGVSKSSKRIGTFELINGMNQKGWYTGDGMTYLYNNDFLAYSDDYWPTVNYYRLPGTTVDTRNRHSGHYQNGDGEGKPSNTWSGGVTLDGIYGASGMMLKAKGSSLSANKSWFMFDDEIVAVGSGINSTDNRMIETIVEQRKINDAGSNELIVNGEIKSNQLGWEETMSNTSWAHLAGTEAHGADIGYYFPNGATIKGIRQSQSGSWYDIDKNPGTSTDIRTKNYMTLWMEQGQNPSNETYSYVILPNKNDTQVESYANNADITIVENTESAHCVRENSLNILAANFWKNKIHTSDIITVNTMASVMLKEDSDMTMTVVVTDPTMVNKDSIIVEIDKDAPGGLITGDDEIKVLQTSPTIKISVNTRDAKGKAFEAKFNVDPDAVPAPIVWYSEGDFSAIHELAANNSGIVTIEYDITPLEDNIDGAMGYGDSTANINSYNPLAITLRMNQSGFIDARNGQAFSALTPVSYNGGIKYKVKIVADMDEKTYDAFITPEGENETQIAESYGFRTTALDTNDLGQLCLKHNHSNSPVFKVENHSIVSSPTSTSFNTIDDAYIRDGKYANDTFGSDTKLVVKSDNTSYARKAYLKFDYASLSKTDIESAILKFYVNYVNMDPSRTVKLYGTHNESWNESDLTWNNAPSPNEYITSIEISNIGWYEVDITNYIKSNIDNKQISIVLQNESAFSGRSDFFISSKESELNSAQLLIK